MSNSNSISKGRLWTSYTLQALLCFMFAMSGIMNLISNPEAIKSAVEMGYITESLPKLGVLILVATLLYAIPKTNILGAILLTAWLGGAVSTHVMHLDPTMNKVMPVIFGIVVWGALLLRDEKLAALLPFRKG